MGDSISYLDNLLVSYFAWVSCSNRTLRNTDWTTRWLVYYLHKTSSWRHDLSGCEICDITVAFIACDSRKLEHTWRTVFEEVDVRSGSLHLVFQSQTLEQLGVFEKIWVINDHYIFEEYLMQHLFTKTWPVWFIKRFESFTSIQFEYGKTGQILIEYSRCLSSQP